MSSFEIRLTPPYLHGVYLAINAIPDAYLLVDAPDCTFFTAEALHCNHDINSTLLSQDGFHRIINTGVTVRSIPVDRSGEITKCLGRVIDSGRPGSVFLASKPMAAVTGIDYELIVKKMVPCPRIPVGVIPCDSLSGDWLDGYAQTLKTIALNIDLSKTTPRDDCVAVIGYFMDRTEQDHVANLQEIRRIIEQGLGRKLVSVWLSGDPFRRLAEAARAGTIISLPHAREAARILAGRTGAQLIETDVPFGLSGSTQWVGQLGKVFGCRDRSELFIEREMKEIIPKLQWLVPHLFLGKTAFFAGDPHMAHGVHSLCHDLGIAVGGPALISRNREIPISQIDGSTDFEPVWDPTSSDLTRSLDALIKTHGRIHIAVANSTSLHGISQYCKSIDMAVPGRMEFGYPSYFHHALTPEPFLGFRGTISFINRMANTLYTLPHM